MCPWRNVSLRIGGAARAGVETLEVAGVLAQCVLAQRVGDELADDFVDIGFAVVVLCAVAGHVVDGGTQRVPVAVAVVV